MEELITSCKGRCRCNPICSFSARRAIEATENFKFCFDGDFCCKRLHRHYGNVRRVLINQYNPRGDQSVRDFACRDIAISLQMSSHVNGLNLLGCCLEFLNPALVFGYAKHDHLRGSSGGGINFDRQRLSWKMRLKVAKDRPPMIDVAKEFVKIEMYTHSYIVLQLKITFYIKSCSVSYSSFGLLVVKNINPIVPSALKSRILVNAF